MQHQSLCILVIIIIVVAQKHENIEIIWKEEAYVTRKLSETVKMPFIGMIFMKIEITGIIDFNLF